MLLETFALSHLRIMGFRWAGSGRQRWRNRDGVRPPSIFAFKKVDSKDLRGERPPELQAVQFEMNIRCLLCRGQSEFRRKVRLLVSQWSALVLGRFCRRLFENRA